jgi:CHAD domain-containing protein
MDRLVDAAESPALTPKAKRPCAKALPSLARRSWKRLRRDARRLDESSPDEHYHAVRKRSKQARYAAEAIGPALGRRRGRVAAKFAKRAAKLQDVLGELQDAVTAEEAIERFVGKHPGQARIAFAAGRLHERQHVARRDARESFPATWRKLDRRKLRSWQ